MALPRIEELYNPILDFLADNGESSLDAIRKYLAGSFYVPEEEAFTHDNKEQYSFFERRANTAVFVLCDEGYIERTRRGFYRLAKKGVDISECNRKIDRRSIKNPDVITPKPLHNTDVEIRSMPEPEMVLVTEVTIKEIQTLKKKDSRFANMIAAGCVILDSGEVKIVPQVVLEGTQTLDQIKMTTPEDIKTIGVYKDSSDSSKMASSREPEKDGFHRGKRPKKDWNNPYAGITANAEKNYDMVKEMLEYIRNNRDFGACLHHLIYDVYNAKIPYISRKSGVKEQKIRRLLKNDPNAAPNAIDLAAIFLVLKVPGRIVEAMFDLSIGGVTPNNEKYITICETMGYSTYEDVNKLCVSEGITEIFIPGLTGSI